VPLAAGWALRRTRELVELILTRRPEGDPLPPRRLRARAGVPGARDYTYGGRQAADELAGALAAADISLTDRRAILDFGCGAGRVLPHIARLAPEADCAGCDIDRAAVDWARAHRPAQRWELSSFEPPLPFADASFDLIYSISVFSHLGASLERRWLRELRRVLEPRGVALLSVHGQHAFAEFRAGRASTAWCPPQLFEREPLRPDDFVFAPYIRSVWTEGELPGVGREYGLAFHGPEYIRKTWDDGFEVLAILERAVTGWQDLVILRRA
jgi:SAM-dependent methyltransferase